MAAAAKSAVRRLLPLLDRVLVEKVIAPTKSLGGVLLPEASAATKINEGVVVAVGPGGRTSEGKTIPMGVKEGSRVLLPDYGGHKIKLGDKEFLLLRDEEILGVFSD